MFEDNIQSGRKGRELVEAGLESKTEPVVREAEQASEIMETADIPEVEDQDSDPEDDVIPETRPAKTTSQRRTMDNLVFSEWVRNAQYHINVGGGHSPPSLNADSPRLQDKLKNQQKIIASPREYQLDLFERAKKKNIIAVLPTGTGKTLIAALLLRHTIEQELEHRKSGQAPRISFFLVDKVALAYQQYRVLVQNLDYNVQRFCGDFSGPSGTYDFWKQQAEQNMVIVCTAAVLQHCLHHAYFKMDQINLLIFDEAHHTKKKHVYAQIIKDFYNIPEMDGLRRPRILGMTASPVDSKNDVQEAAAKLEELLQSEIVTVSPELFQKSSIHQPNEDFIEYGMLNNAFETPLWQKLYKLIGKNECFRKLFTFSKDATSELGRWSADRVWQVCFTEKEKDIISARTSNRLQAQQNDPGMELVNTAQAAIDEAYEVVRDFAPSRLVDDNFFLSHKVLALRNALRAHFDPTKDKCIVFVEQRLSALMLKEIFNQSGTCLTGLKPGVLLGSGATGPNDPSESSMTINAQVSIVNDFLFGDINCLFATSIGEEGLDIPDCNMIVRFDPCKTVIQYIQSRGRGRQRGSKYFHMVQFGIPGHVQSVFDNRDNEHKMSQFCAMLPEDRLLGGQGTSLEHIISQSTRSMVIKASGAKLTYQSSLVILDTFASTLRRRDDIVERPEYIIKSFGQAFQCEVLLPDSSPVRSAVGIRESSKQMAKCAAAFEMCKQLRKNKCLDDHFESTFEKKLPAMRNAHLAISSKKLAQYPMHTKPEFWTGLGMPQKLFLAAMRLTNPEAGSRPSRPLLILTNKPFPAISNIPLFFGNGTNSHVQIIPFQDPIDVSSSDVEGMNEFTLRIFQDVFSKEYQSELEEMPYFFAPSSKPHCFKFTESCQGRELIDWDCLTKTQGLQDEKYLNLESQKVPPNAFVIDPHNGSRKWYTTQSRPDLRPSNNQLPTAPCPPRSRGVERKHNIWNYSISIWNRANVEKSIRDDLEVVEAEFIPLRRNLLDEFEARDEEHLKCYLCFETLKVSRLPVHVVSMAYCLPAVLFRLDSNLIALEACWNLGLEIRPDLALEAMTKDSDNTEDHEKEKINFQSGMGANYERLEFLGDCFLKMATTLALCGLTPNSDEFECHVNRMVLLCNKNLFNNALDLKLEESIRSAAFNRRVWYPEGLKLLKGKQGLAKKVHQLGDKTIADVCEAIIGAAYLTTYDQKNFDMAIQAVTKFVNHANHRMMKWEDYRAAYTIPDWQADHASAADLELASKVQAKLGYEFKYPLLLRSAFTHASFGSITSGRKVPNYQRLEFLGDALYDMVCVDYLFHRFPGANPQWLTEHKGPMVSNKFLGCLCMELGLQRHMLSMTGGLQSEIADYAIAWDMARIKSKAEFQAKDSSSDRGECSPDYWQNIDRQPPKALPDIVEAYMGAIFIDSDFNLEPVQHFFDKHVRPHFEDMSLYDTFASGQPITNLTHKLVHDFGCSNWRLMIDQIHQEDGANTARPTGNGLTSALPSKRDMRVVCGILVHGKVWEHAVADSGRQAKNAAAKKVTAMLEDMDLATFKTQFGCNCGTPEAEVKGDEGEGM